MEIVIGGEEWAYVSPFISGKLSEDEIAIASCIEKCTGFNPFAT